MATTTRTTYRAVVEHGENAEFGRSYNAERSTFAEADADAERLEALPIPEGYTCPRTVKVEQTTVTTTTNEVDWRMFP